MKTKTAKIVRTAPPKSVQPRFDSKAGEMLFSAAMRWWREDFEKIPPYKPDTRQRARWLDAFWRNEPYLAGVINSAVQIDRNRGYSLVGGRNQVLRFSAVLKNWQVQPGRPSWREGVGALALGFYTQDIGGVAEVARSFRRGPMAGLYHLDPTRCVLTSDVDHPLRYYPPRISRTTGAMVELAPEDYVRVASGVSIDETYNGVGYSALSRALELAITMVAIWRHEQEQLFARAPKGLLLLRGITQEQWKNAMTVQKADLDSNRLDWYASVAVLASAGLDDIDAKLVALSQLPSGFDQQTFTDLLMYGYALCFGFDPREFWPVSSGALGTATETEQQHRKATGKGGSEFFLTFQEELQRNLPETLHFEFDQRDAEGELLDATLAARKVEVINAMGDVLTPEQKRILLAEAGLIPREWAEGETVVEATDTEAADSPENEGAAQEAERYLDLLPVRRAMERFPGEPIVRYIYRGGYERLETLRWKHRYYFLPSYAAVPPAWVTRVVSEYEDEQ